MTVLHVFQTKSDYNEDSGISTATKLVSSKLSSLV